MKAICLHAINIDLVEGAEYEVVGIEGEDLRVIDDSGEDYLYGKSVFRIIPEETEPEQKDKKKP
ncbi:MAG: hypothetical protein IAA81_02760 [Spirochaetes bacterium]|uniref:Uncharacterized protein n=1 Tax=Candidatus Gallitreponema excrementavium TaxID=2840840 RepID=A0A9D9HNU9_9SPIR|nr:hypothetical protein [Candidatus Gallitreponema excrementavium]